MGGDIPAPNEWISLPGQVVASGEHPGAIEGWREMKS
jgi:hypothetical protein